jgi:hypothetical protein
MTLRPAAARVKRKAVRVRNEKRGGGATVARLAVGLRLVAHRLQLAEEP